jgi:hypothetical protein
MHQKGSILRSAAIGGSLIAGICRGATHQGSQANRSDSGFQKQTRAVG